MTKYDDSADQQFFFALQIILVICSAKNGYGYKIYFKKKLFVGIN